MRKTPAAVETLLNEVFARAAAERDRLVTIVTAPRFRPATPASRSTLALLAATEGRLIQAAAELGLTPAAIGVADRLDGIDTSIYAAPQLYGAASE